ncbi:hypothetical protein HJC23_003909 [Cyclotella cryptica]|uniref:Uncharacterized protein n=1 Tax=Cyclotella cryptica TaxID=29204 RepID=A0ABD3PUG6_9STRA|eukprot:CCRYP_011445-RA/>CCRYP_011445-RA protein AED:0.03 eAED:0.03 QI:0/-1/0/1/-1/1/1/0/983
METTSAAAAQCHYQAGRYHDALLEFDRCERLEPSRQHADQAEPLLAQVAEKTNSSEQDIGWITADDDRIRVQRSDSKLRIRRPELIALPPLARRADMAMCRFRCVICDPSKLTARGDGNDVSSETHQSHNAPECANESRSSSVKEAWKDAIQTNANYRRALTGAASSLVDSCFQEMEHLHRIKDQQDVPAAIKSPSQSAEDLSRNRKHEQESIQRAMKSTAVAILMAGIASCHLFLHDDITPTLDEQRSNNKAWNILFHSSIAAADLLRARKEFIQFCSSGEKIETRQYVGGSTLESSLQILNENLDDERSAVALHSFRLAVKVTALACGKLVLPKVALQSGEEEEEVEHRPSKRQKRQIVSRHRSEMVPTDTLITKDDAWNTIYRHGDLALHSRERMVDALSFHLAAVHCSARKKEKKASSDSCIPKMINELFQKREVCLDEAIQWEAKLNALVGDAAFLSGPSEDSCRYFWKISSCLRGLDIVGRRHKSMSTKYITECKTKSTLNAIDRLTLSSTSRFACHLMGCFHVQNEKFSRAIQMFRLSLERGERLRKELPSDRGDSPHSYRDIDTDVELSYELVEYRIISNMASCFVALGDANTPLELLLHLWSTLNQSNGSSGTELRPRALFLSCGSNELGKATNAESIINDTARIKLLWMLFHMSSLASDWATCLSAAEELTEYEKTSENPISRLYIDSAHAFALLQCRREKQSQDIALKLIQRLKTYDTHHLILDLVSTLTELHIADGTVMSGNAANATCNYSPAQCTRRAMTSLRDLISSSMVKADSGSIFELRAIVLNNNGVASLVEGDAYTALSCFREASELIAYAQTSMSSHLSWLLIPTHFNLALLYLRDGRIDESAKAWLSIRGHLDTWESAKRGDNSELSSLRDNHLMAMNRHGLIMAKRNVTGGSFDVSWDHKSVMEWVPPVLENQEWQEDSVCIHGVDSAQVSTLDFVLLTYALSMAEKKASSLFRRNAGHVGY